MAVTTQGEAAHALRAVDLSTNGALLRRRGRGRPKLVQRLRLALDDRRPPLEVLARTVWWSKDGWLAVRFIDTSDVDRLDIAEHIDRLAS